MVRKMGKEKVNKAAEVERKHERVYGKGCGSTEFNICTYWYQRIGEVTSACLCIGTSTTR